MNRVERDNFILSNIGKISVKEIANYLGISTDLVYDIAQRHGLSSLEIKKNNYIRDKAINVDFF